MKTRVRNMCNTSEHLLDSRSKSFIYQMHSKAQGSTSGPISTSSSTSQYCGTCRLNDYAVLNMYSENLQALMLELQNTTNALIDSTGFIIDNFIFCAFVEKTKYCVVIVLKTSP